MVTAGVYMVGRNAVLFAHAPMSMEIVAIVGVLTALMAATIGLVQTDIKRVLAYSTVSQLGYMFLATGVGAFAAGIFHLMTHAFFKALLFLGSGSVIHAMAGEQDMRHMGALKRYMPVTFVTMLIGTLAIAGIPPLAGFFSKDEILFRAFLGNRAVWALGAVTAFLTAFYMFRLMSLTFWGGYRGPAWEAHGAGHDQDHGGHGHAAWHGPHESPSVMTVPLMALAVGAIVAGFVGVPQVLGGNNAIERFLEPSFVASSPSRVTDAPRGRQAPRGEGGNLAPRRLSAAGGGASCCFSRWRDRDLAGAPLRHAAGSRTLTERWAGPHNSVEQMPRGQAARDRGPRHGSARGMWAFDRRVIDGAVDGRAGCGFRVDLPSARQVPGRRFGEPRRLGRRRGQLPAAPRADRVDTELRARDGVRRVRVPDAVLLHTVRHGRDALVW
jgi:hypothetical protein